MPNRNAVPPSVRRAARRAVLVVLLAMPLLALPVQAASSVRIDARPLVGGRYEVGGWLGLSVTLVNDGAPTDGYLSTESRSATARRFVELPAGARKVVTLYVQPDAFQREVAVTYAEPNGTVSATVPVSAFEQTVDQVGIVGDTNGALRPQILGADTGGNEPIPLSATDIPERPEPLDGLSAIVWAGDSGSLTEAQRRSLERWVVDGGQLVVVGGPDWQARAAALDDLLPVENIDAVDGVRLAALAAWSGSETTPEPATISTGELRDGARAIVAEGGDVVASYRSIGSGRVIFVGADLATNEFRGWDGAPTLWSRLLPSSAIVTQLIGGFPLKQELEGSMVAALQTIPTLAVPPPGLLLAVIVGYILLIGPVSYIVLRRLDRRELAWVTAPLLVVSFTACSYGIGRAMKGSDVVVNQVAVIRTSPAGAATVETFAGIFSPERATYDLATDADALMGRLDPSADLGDGALGGGDPILVDQGRPARVSDLAIGVFGFQAVRASGIADYAGSLEVAWRVEDGETTGTVTNTSDTPMTDVAYISGGGGVRVGDVAAGASIDFTLPVTNFNGSSASDQIYGFGGLASGTDDQRRVALRRGVIDSLVGRGGMVPVDLGGLGQGGPYLIGWREGEGPMPITVDGVDARRYLSAVEVLSVRPTVERGEVTVRPQEMSVGVTAASGDVGTSQPGSVTIVDGSATFAISLPLEAAGLVATEVDIVAAPDATSFASEPGGMQGFWPEGLTLELRNPLSGQWTELGDLSEGALYAIDDPDDAINGQGVIEVRVSGSVDPQFGQQNVFVSASVTGGRDQ
ncbi:MAG TPA: hypothetical protein VFW95_12035 [Candidatus Limnocylindria bacterium]|nr:hypothetical protein [Candidatus Limnocylindria bacterium]